MTNAETFEREINLIEDENLRQFVTNYLNDYVPSYFWEIGASSSGKYHPKFAQGKGGLVRHTKAVVMFAEELLRMNSYQFMPTLYKDFVIIACICHDTCKYGIAEYDTSEYSQHGENAEILMAHAWNDMFHETLPDFLGMAVLTHMGQWGEVKPFTNIDRCVHMADYMASRNFIDIPSLSEEII